MKKLLFISLMFISLALQANTPLGEIKKLFSEEEWRAKETEYGYAFTVYHFGITNQITFLFDSNDDNALATRQLVWAGYEHLEGYLSSYSRMKKINEDSWYCEDKNAVYSIGLNEYDFFIHIRFYNVPSKYK